MNQEAFHKTQNGDTTKFSFGQNYKFEQNNDFGVLLLHGYTSALDAVSGIVPKFESEAIDYKMPTLRGHGTKYQDLRNVQAVDWLQDAQKSYEQLLQTHPKVLVIGLSMGGLLALNLAAQNPETCLGIVTWAAALTLKNPAAHFAGIIKHFVKFWPGQESFNDPECRKNNKNYSHFSTDSFNSLYLFAQETRSILPQVRAPLCVIHSKKDQVVKPKSAETIFKNVHSPYRELHLLAHSGHELGQDLQCNEVFEITMQFIQNFRTTPHN